MIIDFKLVSRIEKSKPYLIGAYKKKRNIFGVEKEYLIISGEKYKDIKDWSDRTYDYVRVDNHLYRYGEVILKFDEDYEILDMIPPAKFNRFYKNVLKHKKNGDIIEYKNLKMRAV